jgi:CRP-like cAMP-binding protein
MVAVISENLRRIPLFEGFTSEEFDRLEKAAKVSTLAPGDLVLRQGERSQDLWVVLEGTCEVIFENPAAAAQEPVVLATLEAMSHFGEMSFFHDAPHSASVRAKTSVRLLRLPRAKFDELLRTHSTIAAKLSVNVVRSLAERMRRMDQWVVELKTARGQAQDVAEWAELREKLFEGWQL